MSGILLRIRTWWETADRTQRVVTVFGSAFLVFLLVGTMYFASQPKMAMAYGGLTPADQGRVVGEIQKLGIPVQFDQTGAVLVPSDKVAEVQSKLAATGLSPTSGHLGSSDRSKIGMMSPKSVEEAQLNAIREGEIAQTLEALTGVAAAKVLLSTGERNAFASEDDPPSASVTITEQPGADLSGAPAKAMASLVAKAVPGLSTKNVTIVNQDGVSLFDGTLEEGATASYTNKVQAQVQEARRVKRELQPLLDRFGVGSTVLTVRVEMDFDKRSERTVGIEPGKSPISEQVAEESMSGGSAPGAGGIAGAASNTAAPAIGEPTGSNNNYTSTQKSREFPYTQRTTETEKAPGTVTATSISVLVNEEKIKDVTPIQQALEGYLGKEKIDSGEFSVTVTPAKFDPTQEKTMETAAAAAAGRDRMQQIMSILPIAALLLVAIMIIKALGKVAKSSNVLVTAGPGGQLMPIATVNAISSGAPALEAGSHSDMVPTMEEIAAYEMAAATKKRKKKPNSEEFEEEEDEPMRVRIGRINEKINVPLEQIKKMSNERPESVAMLLKSWLVEERR